MPESSPTYKVKYFQTNQFSILVSTQGGTEDDLNALTKELIAKSSEIIQGFDGYENAKLSPASQYYVDPVPSMDHCYVSKLSASRSPVITPRGKSSLAFVDIEGGDEDQIRFFRMINGLEAQLRNGPPREGVTLDAVSPSWLVRSVSEGSGTGGPGGWPMAYRGAPELAPYQIRYRRIRNRLIDDAILWIRALLAETLGFSWPKIRTLEDIVTNTNKGEGVHVIILDTIPTSDTNRAYQRYKDKHPLINSLLTPNGRLKQYPLDPTIKTEIDGLTAVAHDYDMSDHGLFVAGVIHTIAPLAKLHLIEVLNCNGIGNSDSMTFGLNKALQIMKDTNNASQSFVVNCSFTVDLPLEARHLLTRVFAGTAADFFTRWDKELEDEILKKILDPVWLASQKTWLQQLCDTIYYYESRVIAAAGNDRLSTEEDAPQARMPAALSSVQGVGALPRLAARLQNGQRSTASYSNLADTPSRIGIVTLGGEAGEWQGVLGLYLGQFPGGEANNTNWAWWPGTSFATPILSGITALTLSDMAQSASAPGGTRSRQVAQQAIDRMYNIQRIIEDGRAEGGADILDVIQG